MLVVKLLDAIATVAGGDDDDDVLDEFLVVAVDAGDLGDLGDFVLLSTDDDVGFRAVVVVFARFWLNLELIIRFRS